MTEPNYAETIAALRQEAAQREGKDLCSRVNELTEQITEAERTALECESQGDHESALSYAAVATDNNRELLETLAKLPPSGPPEYAVKFFQDHKAFFDRHGQRGFEACAMAHQYATAPRDPDNPRGMGLAPGTPEYDHARTNLLEMYGRDAGVDFNPDETLTADEAAKISGVSAKEYNRQVRKLYETGKDSGTQYSRQFGRDVG